MKPGQQVIVEDCSMCGVCEDCKRGQAQFCRKMYNLEGQPGMGEYLSVRFNSLMSYEGLGHVTACLTEPLAVALTAVLNAQIPLGGSVVGSPTHAEKSRISFRWHILSPWHDLLP